MQVPISSWHDKLNSLEHSHKKYISLKIVYMPYKILDFNILLYVCLPQWLDRFIESRDHDYYVWCVCMCVFLSLAARKKQILSIFSLLCIEKYWKIVFCSQLLLFPTTKILKLIFYFIFYCYSFYCSGFCHTLKWNSHGFTCVPHPDPPSHLPLHPILLGLPSAPGLSACLMHPTWAGDLFHPS